MYPNQQFSQTLQGKIQCMNAFQFGLQLWTQVYIIECIERLTRYLNPTNKFTEIKDYQPTVNILWIPFHYFFPQFPCVIYIDRFRERTDEAGSISFTPYVFYWHVRHALLTWGSGESIISGHLWAFIDCMEPMWLWAVRNFSAAMLINSACMGTNFYISFCAT